MESGLLTIFAAAATDHQQQQAVPMAAPNDAGKYRFSRSCCDCYEIDSMNATTSSCSAVGAAAAAAGFSMATSTVVRQYPPTSLQKPFFVIGRPTERTITSC
jgi:hypothetical protein